MTEPTPTTANTSADVSRTATTATVRIAGSILSVVPGWAPTVTSQVAVPVERLT